MKRRITISRFLLFVSFIMLTASVFPHHHHRDLFCLQADIIETVSDCHHIQQSCGHNHSADSSSCCENDNTSECDAFCITNFHFSEPDVSYDTMEPHYTLQSILFTLTTLQNLLPYPEQNGCNHYCLYHEKLHCQYFSKATGLRAPPCC